MSRIEKWNFVVIPEGRSSRGVHPMDLLLLNMVRLYAFMVKYQVFDLIRKPGEKIEIYQQIFPYLVTFM